MTTGPSRLLMMIDFEMIQEPGGEVLDEIVNRFRMVVEGWHRRDYPDTDLRKLQHVFEVNRVERALTRYEQERAALLEADICGSVDEITHDAVCEARQCPHTAGNDDHAVTSV